MALHLAFAGAPAAPLPPLVPMPPPLRQAPPRHLPGEPVRLN